MGHHRDRLGIASDKIIHFLKDSCFKIPEGLPRGRGDVRIAIHPPPGVLRIHLFNLSPTQAIPLAKINLAQCRTKGHGIFLPAAIACAVLCARRRSLL